MPGPPPEGGDDGCAYPTLGQDRHVHGGGDGPVWAYDESHGVLPPAGADKGDAAYRGATLSLLGAVGRRGQPRYEGRTVRVPFIPAW